MADDSRIACLVCGQRSEPVFTATVRGRFAARFARCQACGFVQAIDPDWLDAAYESAINETDLGLVSRSVRMARLTRNVVCGFLDPAAAVLDYGGGYGITVRMLRDSGIHAWRWDPYCKNLFARSFESPPDDGRRFHLVTAFEVAEHLPDPLETFSRFFCAGRQPVFLHFPASRSLPGPRRLGILRSRSRTAHCFLYAGGPARHRPATRQTPDFQRAESPPHDCETGILLVVPAVGQRPLFRAGRNPAPEAPRARPRFAVAGRFRSLPGGGSWENQPVASVRTQADNPRRRTGIMNVLFDHQAFANQRVGRSFPRFPRDHRRSGQARTRVGPVPFAPLHRSNLLAELKSNRLPNLEVKTAMKRPPWAFGFGKLSRQINPRLLRRFAARLQPDVFYPTWYDRRCEIRPDAGAATLVVVHDMIPEKFPRFFPGQAEATAAKRHFIHRADVIVAVSRNTRADLLEYYPEIDPARIVVAPLATRLRPPRQAPAPPRPFLLYVGHRGGYKNFVRLAEAFAASDALKKEFQLVCFGGKRPSRTELRDLQQLGLGKEDIRIRPGAMPNSPVITPGHRRSSTLRFTKASAFPCSKPWPAERQ